MDLINSIDFELRNIYFTTVYKLFRKYSSEVENCILWSSIQALQNQVSKKSFYTFEDIDSRESDAKVHKKPSETLGADSILRLEISIYCLPRNFNWFLLYFAQCSFTEMKTRFIKLQNESLGTVHYLLGVRDWCFGVWDKDFF